MKKQILFISICLIASGCGNNFLLDNPSPKQAAAGTHISVSKTTALQLETSTCPPTIIITTTPSPKPPLPTPTATANPTPTPAVLVGAGDISICGQEGDDQTAKLLDQIEGTIFTTGDNSNENASLWEFITCFGPSWGRHLERIRPAAGNHEYYTEEAVDYFKYFGDAAGEPGKGYYSYDLGNWHIIVLNSNCGWIGGCGPSSAQVAWLTDDLKNNQSLCTMAIWHDPRWSSGLGGSSFWLSSFWDLLYEYNAEIVVSGDDHNYERFAPVDPAGEIDLERGVRQFVVGTGGASQRPFDKILQSSEIQHSGTYGVLKFLLFPDRYEWEFIPVEGDTFTDKGIGYCH